MKQEDSWLDLVIGVLMALGACVLIFFMILWGVDYFAK